MQIDDQGGALVPHDEKTGEPARQEPGQVYRPDSDPRAGWASWDVTTDEGFALLQTVKHGETLSLADYLNQVIHVRHFYVVPKESANPETGEVTTYPLIFLVAADGKVYVCGSNGVMESLRDLYRWKPVLPWEPPLPVTCVAKKLPGGRRYFSLLYTPVPRDVTKKGGKNGA